jgi:hypothetical protein
LLLLQRKQGRAPFFAYASIAPDGFKEVLLFLDARILLCPEARLRRQHRRLLEILNYQFDSRIESLCQKPADSLRDAQWPNQPAIQLRYQHHTEACLVRQTGDIESKPLGNDKKTFNALYLRNWILGL